MYLQISLIVLFFLFNIKSLEAQNNTVIDSLENLAINSQSPSEKSELYHAIARQFLGVDFDKAEKYEHLAFKFCAKDNYEQLGNCYGVFTAIYAQTSRSEKAVTSVDSSIYYYKLAKDTVGLAMGYNMKGAIHIQLEEFEYATQTLYKSLELAKKMGDIENTLTTMLNLMDIYRITGEHDKIIESSKEVLHLADSTNNNRMKAFAYQAMGSATFNASQLDASLVHYQKAIAAFKNINHLSSIATLYADVGHIYALKNKPKQASKMIQEAKKFESFISSITNYIDFNLDIAHIYYLSEQYQKSAKISQEMLDSAYALGSLYYQEQSLNRLMKNMVKLKEFEKAYNYQSQRSVILDSLTAREKVDEILDLRTKYETEKIEQENALLAKEKELEKLRANTNQKLLYLAIFAIAIILIISILLMRQYKTNAAHLTNQLKHRLLRNQMSPHFIFNSLVAIQNFVYKKAPIKAGEYLASFAQLIRAILENSMEEYIPIEKEIQWLDNYLQLQLLRFDNSFDYTIDLDKSIDLENMLIPPMLTQPFIENAIEHGLKELDYKGEIRIKMSLKDEILHIEVLDNGVGLELANARKGEKKHQSLALKITKERLSFLNKKRRKNIFFDMKNLDSKGTLVSFSLPLKYKY